MNVSGVLRWVLLPVVSLFAVQAGAEDFDDDDYLQKRWQESEVVLPASPSEASLLSFYVSAATENRFFIDGATLAVGSDGVVRYVLVVVSPQGVRNVTFEGMRCDTKERRVYAAGRMDGSWSKGRRDEWVPIRDAYANRHHTALYNEYFCPVTGAVKTAAEAKEALMRGGARDLLR